MPAKDDIVLLERKPLTGGDAQLQLDEIEARHELGDRVLDLQARVHLQEEELAPGARDRRSARRSPRRCTRTPGRARRRPCPWRSRNAASTTGEGASSITFWWRRCRLHSRSPRCRTLPCAVRDHLHLEVARTLEVALDQQPIVAEGGVGLTPGRGERLGQLVPRANDPHPLAAAAGGGLDEKRQLAAPRATRSIVVVGQRLRGPAPGRREARRPPPPPWRRSCRRAAPSPRGSDRRTSGRRRRTHGRSRAARTGSRTPDGSRRRRPRGAASTTRSTLRYDSDSGAGPSRTARSAAWTCGMSASASLYTATDSMPRRRSVLATRTAISPRFAMRTQPNTVLRAPARVTGMTVAAPKHTDRGARHAGHQAPSARAITMCWISSVPSPIVRILASR